MAIDKQIFELPVATLLQLTSGAQVGFVAQIAGYDLDFQVTPEVLQQLFGNTTGSTKYTGSSNPDPANGRNGDVYVQDNGKVYIKTSGAWQLVKDPTISSLPPVYIPIEGIPDQDVDLDIPAGYYGERAYVLNSENKPDISRITNNMDGTFTLKLLDTQTMVVFI
jgi:hypothetical protein